MKYQNILKLTKIFNLFNSIERQQVVRKGQNSAVNSGGKRENTCRFN